MSDEIIPSSAPTIRVPAIFSGIQGLHAGFTERSPQINPHGAIPGLNFGRNTIAPSHEIEASFDLLCQSDHLWRQRAWVRQVHGTRILDAVVPGEQGEADGLVTRSAGLALSIQVADCAALLLADPLERVIAAVHAGWKGAAGGIVREAVAHMRGLGADSDRILAWISPCISKRRFEVGEEVAALFDANRIVRSHSKPHVDLRGAIMDQLASEGVAVERIEADPSCTYEDPSSFHSFRRDGERSGRMLAIIAFEPLRTSDHDPERAGAA
jgi:YfiH family protein